MTQEEAQRPARAMPSADRRRRSPHCRRCSTSVPRVVEEIGRIKQRSQMPIYEPKREDEVFANVTSANRAR